MAVLEESQRVLLHGFVVHDKGVSDGDHDKVVSTWQSRLLDRYHHIVVSFEQGVAPGPFIGSAGDDSELAGGREQMFLQRGPILGELLLPK